MQNIHKSVIIIFFIVLIVPVILFNREKDAISDIDNRVLAKSPFQILREKEENEKFDFSSTMDQYVNDRIGLRNEMILSYTVLNDRLFNEMIHPSYSYGQDGYVFSKLSQCVKYSSFHDNFVEMVAKIKVYCDEREVPFYFMFEPSKTTCLQEYLPKGYNYNRAWVDEMIGKMDSMGINVVDNSKILSELAKSDTPTFNVKFDAGHWNDYGAYYGVNNLLNQMKADGIDVTVNSLEDFSIGETTATTLLVSQFPIDEKIPTITIDVDEEDIGSKYSGELNMHPKYKGFFYWRNKGKVDGKKVLVFQGSYMNGKGAKFLFNSFSEYIAVHDYENTMNFDYYYNIFKPDFVVVEVAENACTERYFSTENMEKMKLNSLLEESNIESKRYIDREGLNFEKGKTLTQVSWLKASFGNCLGLADIDPNAEIWIKLNDEIFDMRASSSEDVAYQCTIENARYDEDAEILMYYKDESGLTKIEILQ